MCEFLKINAVSPAESAFLTDVPHYSNACYSLSSTQELNRQHPSLSRFPKILVSKLLPSHMKDARDVVRQERCTAGLAAEQSFLIKVETRDFPGDPVVRNPPSNAEDAGSIPRWGIISHIPQGGEILLARILLRW